MLREWQPNICSCLSVRLARPYRWPSKVYFCQLMTIIINAFCFTLLFLQLPCLDKDIYTTSCWMDHRESDQYPSCSWWIVRFPTSMCREEMGVPPYQRVLQCPQLPLDCLPFCINSQGILFPWQQFPADTKNQVSPWKFKLWLATAVFSFACSSCSIIFRRKLGFSQV